MQKTLSADSPQLTAATGVHTETRSYTGPETPHGCGPDAEYKVTWSILGPETPVVKPIHPLPVKKDEG